jgi:uncharacterized membrane protein YgaE (UPF0421/DUF939 family)
MTHVRHLAWRLAEPPPLLPPLAIQSLKVAIACGLAWWLGQLLGSPRPFDAVLAAIILMQGHAYGSLLNALQFLVGVVAGLVLGIVADRVVGVSPPVLAALMFVCLLMGGWLKVSSQGFNNQIAVSALLVLASGSATNIARLWETALGGAIGVLVAALLWPPNPVRGLRQEYREILHGLRSDVLRGLELVGAPAAAGDAEAHRRRVRSHSERADAAVAQVAPAEDALRWNPWHFGRINDLSQLEDRLRLLAYLYRTVRALARQAAEASRELAGADDWDQGRGQLLAAGTMAIEAVERRLNGQEGGDAIARGREAVARFAAAAPRDRHAIALGAALDDLLTDVEEWRPPKEVVPDRLLVARVLRRLGGSTLLTRSPAVQAELEFEEERRHAVRQDLAATMKRRAGAVPPLSDVVRAAGIAGETERGVRDIPLALIRGSETRSTDFDDSFLPRRRQVRRRWVELFTTMQAGVQPPPIDVYQLGDAYFVKDGLVRVSVARHLGWDRIRANVVEVTTRAPVGSDVSGRELLGAAEYVRFLETTQLDVSRPEARLEVSQLGRYDVIFEHILGHRYFLGREGREVSVPEAAASWYDSVYRPLMDVARAHDLHERLPGWTDADIYLELTRRWLDLEEEGRPAGPEGAAGALLAEQERATSPRLSRLLAVLRLGRLLRQAARPSRRWRRRRRPG